MVAKRWIKFNNVLIDTVIYNGQVRAFKAFSSTQLGTKLN